MAHNVRFPLHNAARAGDVVAILRHLKEGIPVNHLNYDQMTPLHEACTRGHFQCAKLLIDNNAMVDSPNIDGATPLCEASAAGSMQCIQLLLAHGANVNPPLTISSPLHHAIVFARGESRIKCVQFLVDSGAKLDASDCHVGTALHLATGDGSVECVRILLTAGAAVNATKTHESALHIAACLNFVEVALLLLEFGANVYLRDNGNRTPRDLALADGSLRHILHCCEVTPKSLVEICRWKIRQALGSKRIKSVAALGLPRSLTSYLQHHVDVERTLKSSDHP